MRSPERVAIVLLGVLVLLELALGRQLHEVVEVDSAEALSQLPEILARVSVQKPLEGEVAAPTLPFGLSVKPQNGSFPDILLSMEVFQDGADVDFRCSAFNASEENYAKREYSWQSNSAQGTDYLFISTNSSQYRNAISETEDVADFLCLIERHNGVSPQFSIEMDITYEKRTLVDEESEAMKGIYDKCCKNTGACQGWIENWHSVEIESKHGKREVTNFDFCHMTSSVCDKEGHLLKLYMDKFGLQCQFPIDEISKLKRLQKLVLSWNDLSENIYRISRSLSKLSNLDEVVLAHNRISGALSIEFTDELTNPLCILVRQSLQHLHLEDNVIKGPLPNCLFQSDSKLRDLILDYNPIAGTIPDVFSSKSHLEVIQLSDANLTGQFPRTLTHLRSLKLLDLSNNDLEGLVPSGFGSSKILKHLHLSHNRFEGKVPPGIAASVSLESVDLSHNEFDSVPAQWLKEGPKTPIVNLDLSHNQIADDFPAAIALFPKLSTLYMNKNKFQGPLPEVHNMFPNTWAIDLSDNAFIGGIPREWATIGLFLGTADDIPYTAPVFNLSNNKFSGILPEFFHDASKLPSNLVRGRRIDVSGNSFSCPENGNILHLIGMERCAEVTQVQKDEDGVFGDRAFNISEHLEETPADGISDLTSISENSATGEVHTTSGESIESEVEDNSKGAPVLVILLCVFGAFAVLSALVVIALRHRARKAEKKVIGSPKEKDEGEGEVESNEPSYVAKDEAENSRLRVSTMASSDEIRL